MATYKVSHTTPDVQTYISLRTSSGLSPRTTQAAEAGLANTLFAVQAFPSSSPDNAIGMGRIVGDNGSFFLIVDMAVLPAHQGKGVGKMIMKELKDWTDKNVPPSGCVLLLADGPAKYLYRKFGFVETADWPIPSVGMACEY